MQTHKDGAVTLHDLMSINDLVEYLSLQKNFHRENIYYLLEAEFAVSNVVHIKRSDFDRAIALLVELQNVTVH